MPLSEHKSFLENEMAKIFWGLIPIRNATSYMSYIKSSPYTHILFELKYHGCPEIGRFMGHIMAKELTKKGFFDGIDLIIPIPLSRQKERQRGYNQSLWIAYGISDITGIRIETGNVIRMISNPSQTTLSHAERKINVKDIFNVKEPERLKGKHILLVDDVLTSGATMLSCAETIAKSSHVTISVLTLAQANGL